MDARAQEVAAGESEGHPSWQCGNFEPGLDYLRPCLLKKKAKSLKQEWNAEDNVAGLVTL